VEECRAIISGRTFEKSLKLPEMKNIVKILILFFLMITNYLISQNNYQLYVLYNQSHLAGYYEILVDNDLNFEIAYLGIFKEFFGKKIGAYLLAHAIENCFIQGARRVWVHTCTLDHPNALKNYLARGMTIFKTEKIFFNPENL
jgi:GNAT superfamily N-acetyltransferase